MRTEAGMDDSASGALRVARVWFLAFVALLPIQPTILSVAHLAIFPGDVALAVSAMALGLVLWREQRWRSPIFRSALGVAGGLCLVAALPSVLFSENPTLSAAKWLGAAVYVLMALVAASLARSETDVRDVVRAWLVGTAATAGIALLAVALFYAGKAPSLVASLVSGAGSLPPGHYPRVGALVHQARPNTLCHYLSASVPLVCLAMTRRWIPRLLAAALLVATLVAAAFTLSLACGGIALGLGWWIAIAPHRLGRPLRWCAMAAGLVAAAGAFVLAVVSPARPAPGALSFVAFRLAPSARVVCWQAAWAQASSHPLVGRGMGLQPTCPPYVLSSGATAYLSDAHNMYLSLLSTQGLLGLLGFGAVAWIALRGAPPLPRLDAVDGLAAQALTISFVSTVLYGGLTGAFEYTRHGWVLIGLLAASRESPRASAGPGGPGERAC